MEFFNIEQKKGYRPKVVGYGVQGDFLQPDGNK